MDSFYIEHPIAFTFPSLVALIRNCTIPQLSGLLLAQSTTGLSFEGMMPCLTNLYVRCLACSVTQSCLTLCDPTDCSPPGSSVHGILQARILERIAILVSRGFSRTGDQTRVSCIAGRFFPVGATGKTKVCLDERIKYRTNTRN